MKSIVEMDCVQIEITNNCTKSCSNCTRLVGHFPQPYYMELDQFKQAVDSLVDLPGNKTMVGVMGGEPLLHPKFAEMCEYLNGKIPAGRCGLWSTFPGGKEQYAEIICRTFGNIFLNDHNRPDILHGPILVASEELEAPQWVKDYWINNCWIQNNWSCAINPRGAFFCEVAASLSMLLKDDLGWEVKPGWWQKVPKDYVDQMERYCTKCGVAMPLNQRPSVEGIDDISPKMFDRIKATSPKIKRGDYDIHNLRFSQDKKSSAAYKDCKYREQIANRYGISLAVNQRGYNTPFLKPGVEKYGKPVDTETLGKEVANNESQSSLGQ